MLYVNDLHVCYYKDIFVLRGVSIRIEKGTTAAIIGPNGAGKSTMLKAIYNLIPKHKGRVSYDGIDVTHKKPHELSRIGLAYIPQQRSVFPWLTVNENLLMGTWNLRRDEVEEKLGEVYERYPILRQKRNELALNLSGGQQRILEFCRALLQSPKMMMLDEPTSGLDPKSVNLVLQEIKRLKDEGMTILLVEQNVKKAVEMADYVYIMKNGEIDRQAERDSFEKDLHEVIKEWLV